MKKRMFGKLNMVLSTRVALVLALMLALTGCSSAKATPGNPASSGASVGTTSETTTPQSTPSSNASTADAGNDTTPVETSSDATELAEANQDTPSSIVVGTPSTVNPDDFWVSDDEYDLIGYFTACGGTFIRLANSGKSLEMTFPNNWRMVIKLTDSGNMDGFTLGTIDTSGNEQSSSYFRAFDQNAENGIFIKIHETNGSLGTATLNKIFSILYLTETPLSGTLPEINDIP